MRLSDSKVEKGTFEIFYVDGFWKILRDFFLKKTLTTSSRPFISFKSRNRTWRICKITTEITSFMGLSGGHWRLVITKLSNPRITPKGKIAR